LSQQAVPSAGCAQHAPSLSSGIVLGVQHAEPPLFGVQHEATSECSLMATSTLLLASTGTSSGSSMLELFFIYKDGAFFK